MITSVSILLTKKCNLRCAHCIVNAGPDQHEAFNLHLLKEIARGAAMKGIRFAGITGGEPALDRDLLKKACQIFKQENIAVIIATNAFWASSNQEAGSFVYDLKKWGVTGFVFSTDLYHQKWIPTENIFRAAHAAELQGISYEVHVTVPDSSSAREQLAYLKEKGVKKIYLNPLELSGRARGKGKSHDSLDLRVYSCRKVENPLVMPSGMTLACCDLLSAPEYIPDPDSPLNLGNAFQKDFELILETAERNPYLVMLRMLGPDGIFERLSAAERAVVKENGCKLCFNLLNSPLKAKAILDTVCRKDPAVKNAVGIL